MLLVLFGSLLAVSCIASRATNLVMIYLLVVVVAALYLGAAPLCWLPVLSVLVFDFSSSTYLTLAVSDTSICSPSWRC